MTLEERIGALLKDKRLTVSLAESCTGGLIASRITDVAGASEYFTAGLVTYSNSAKTRYLNVSEDVIGKNGAVSAEVAGLMARGAREGSGADIGLSVTGIAGPTGGSAEKPVGTVFIGLATVSGILVRRFQLTGNRKEIRQGTADHALTMMLDHLEGRLS